MDRHRDKGAILTPDTEDLLWRRFNEWFRARRPDYPSEWDAYQAGHTAAKAENAAPVVGRWYFVANDGAATLCVDEADARESAAEADIAFPRMAPHRAVQLVPADQFAAAGEPVAFAHFAESGKIRLWAPERPRDLDGKPAQPLYTADQLAAAVAAERERAATVVDEKIGSVCEANPGRGGRINSAVAFALDALGDCAGAIRAGAKEPSDG